MSLRGEELLIDGQAMDVNITGSLTGASLVSDYQGATRLTLTIYDPRMDLMRSGALTKPGKPSKGQAAFKEAAWDRFSAARLNLDGISFRLAGAQFSYNYETRSTTVIFEDELATVMRLRDEALKVSRGADTRAEFIGRLVTTSVKRAKLPFTSKGRYFSPQAGQRQPIAEPDDDGRTKGFAKGHKIPIKTGFADAEQRSVLTEALTECDRLRAGERATLADICAMITESNCRNLTGGDADSSGPLQVQKRTAVGIYPNTVIDPRTGNVHGSVVRNRPIPRGALDPRDVTEVTRLFQLQGYAAYRGGAIKYAADNPDAEIYEIAQAMQGSGAGAASNGQSNYGPWVDQAKQILDLWGGAGQLHSIRESFEFRAGGRTNGRSSTYWDDSGTLADVVRWRRFAHRNRIWFVPDSWLFERSPTLVIDGEDGPAGLAAQGVHSFDTSQVDIGLPQSELTFRVFMTRWEGPPGSVVLLRNLGPLDGKWLIAVNDQDIYASNEESTLTLTRPAPVKKEPAPNTNTRRIGTPDSPGDLVYPLSAEGTIIATPADHAKRPFGNWQSDNAVDLGVKRGTKVFAVADGTILKLGGAWRGGTGNPDGFNVTLKTSSNAWFYTHLMEREDLVVGQKVSAGDPLGLSGAANNVDHLHLGVQNGDPIKLLGLK